MQKFLEIAYENDTRIEIEMYLTVFGFVGLASVDIFCLLGAVDGVLPLDFLFPSRASLALSRRRLP